ncbi:MAG: hypothetical protein Ct9H300mP8_09960 [Gammaproteobacteria bacterium]|nr:MAG: hypothetical protein Ct9H300mP8_09960 [Gammaproteobacteria bacterium]
MLCYFGASRRCLHDRLADTMVVRKRDAWALKIKPPPPLSLKFTETLGGTWGFPDSCRANEWEAWEGLLKNVGKSNVDGFDAMHVGEFFARSRRFQLSSENQHPASRLEG